MPGEYMNKPIIAFEALTVRQRLFLIVLLGFSIRLYMALNAVTISGDGVIYMQLGREFSSGNYYGVFDSRVPPAYPFAVAIASYVVPDYELAGRLVSLCFGTLVIIMVYFLGKMVYDENIGLIASFFVSIHHYMIRYSGEVLTEGLYYSVFTVTVITGLLSLSRKSPALMFLAGFLSAVSYLVRPEGIVILGLLSLWILFHRREELKNPWTRLKLVFSGWLAAVVVSLPYLVFLYKEYGSITISGKMPFLSSFLSYLDTAHLAENLKGFPSNLQRAFTLPFFVFFFIGVYKLLREDSKRGDKYFLLFLFAPFCLLYLVVLPERRYFVELMPLALVFSASGFRFIEGLSEQWLKGKAPVVAAILLIGIAAFQMEKSFPLKTHNLSEKLAGKWFRENISGERALMTCNTWDSSIFAFYGDGRQVNMKGSTLEEVIRHAEETGVEHLACNPLILRQRIEDFDAKKDGFLKEIALFKDKSDEFAIYIINPGSR
jgi:4-amino-4-deoxy-L-arabinose transferase-like glycosyltransferase